VELITNMEEEEIILERIIDPRLGAAEKQSAEGATTIISDMDDAGMTMIPAPGVDIENGLQLITNKLSYDDTAAISSTNAPHLYVSENCANMIYALQEYTASGGKNEATKDPIDCLRYIAVSNPDFMENQPPDRQNTTGVY